MGFYHQMAKLVCAAYKAREIKRVIHPPHSRQRLCQNSEPTRSVFNRRNAMLAVIQRRFNLNYCYGRSRKRFILIF